MIRASAMLITSLCIALLTSGCAMMVRSEVSRFHNLPATGQGMTFAVLPYKEQEGSLEFARYADLIADQLNQRGYRRVTDANSAQLAVFIAYAIDGGTTTTSSMPIFGQTGGGVTTYNSSTMGTIGRTNFTGNTIGSSYTPPTYGQIGSMPVTNTTFNRAMTIAILNTTRNSRGEFEPRFEAKTRSTGSSGSLAQVVPAMVEAAFKDFPGKNGETITVATPLRR